MSRSVVFDRLMVWYHALFNRLMVWYHQPFSLGQQSIRVASGLLLGLSFWWIMLCFNVQISTMVSSCVQLCSNVQISTMVSRLVHSTNLAELFWNFNIFLSRERKAYAVFFEWRNGYGSVFSAWSFFLGLVVYGTEVFSLQDLWLKTHFCDFRSKLL